MKLKEKGLWKLGLGIFLLYLCIHYWPSVVGFLKTCIGAAGPLLLGCVIAYLVNILMRWYERRFFPKSQKKFVVKGRRALCMLLAFVTLLAVIALVVALVVPQLISCVQLLLAELPGAMEDLIDGAQRLGILPEDLASSLEAIDWGQRGSQVTEVLSKSIGGVMGNVVKTVSSVFSGTVTTLIGLIFAVYLLAGKDTLGRQFERLMKRYLSEARRGKVQNFLRLLDDCFSRFIVGQCTEAVILGLLCLGGMLLFRLPYAGMISALIAFTALIPVAGAYIGAFVGAFMILTVSPAKALGFLVFIVVLQQLEGNLIYPRVVGSSIGLPGIWVLAAVTVGGGVLGVTGMLIGVPLASAVYRLLREDMQKAAAAPVPAEGPVQGAATEEPPAES